MLANTAKTTSHAPTNLPLDGNNPSERAKPQNELINQTRRKRGGRSWTPAQRAAASQRAAQNKPWVYATGPRTDRGRKTSSKNARKHGLHTAEMKKFRQFMRDNARLLTLLNQIITAAKQQKKLVNMLAPLGRSIHFTVCHEDDPVNFLLAKNTSFPVWSPP